MREIVIDDVTHEVSATTFEHLLSVGAIVETPLGEHVLNDDHQFSAYEVKLLLSVE